MSDLGSGNDVTDLGFFFPLGRDCSSSMCSVSYWEIEVYPSEGFLRGRSMGLMIAITMAKSRQIYNYLLEQGRI